MYNPAVGDWYTSAALMEPLLNFNPDNTGEAMAKRIGQVANLLRDIQIDSAANPHSQYAYDRILVTSTKAYLRSSIHRVLTDTTNNVMISQLVKSLVKVYLDDLFALKREYLRLWDQENGDYERYVVMNRYDALAREVLDLDRHVFVKVESGKWKVESDAAQSKVGVSSLSTSHFPTTAPSTTPSTARSPTPPRPATPAPSPWNAPPPSRPSATTNTARAWSASSTC